MKRADWQPEAGQPVEPTDDTPLESFEAVVSRCARRHGLTSEDLTGRSRLAHICRARVDAYKILRAAPHRWSLIAIGRAFGRDHTSIIYGLSR